MRRMRSIEMERRGGVRWWEGDGIRYQEREGIRYQEWDGYDGGKERGYYTKKGRVKVVGRRGDKMPSMGGLRL